MVVDTTGSQEHRAKYIEKFTLLSKRRSSSAPRSPVLRRLRCRPFPIHRAMLLRNLLVANSIEINTFRISLITELQADRVGQGWKGFEGGGGEGVREHETQFNRVASWKPGRVFGHGPGLPPRGAKSRRVSLLRRLSQITAESYARASLSERKNEERRKKRKKAEQREVGGIHEELPG